MERDHFMVPEAALKYGIVDKILEKREVPKKQTE